MISKIFLVISKPFAMNVSAEYVIGVIIASFILAYLLYSLVKPEKF